MPIYEYHCSQCEKRVSIFWRSIKEAKGKRAKCPACGSEELSRLVSPFKRLRGKSSAELPFSESELEALNNEDPKAMARLFQRMSKEMDEPMEGDMEEVVDRLAHGEEPEKVEKDMEKSPKKKSGKLEE